MIENITVRCKLETKRTDAMGYTTYVFVCEDGTYIMCTRYPNWEHAEINIGDDGFLEYQEIEAGKSYYHPKTKEERIYNYDKIQFIKFVPAIKHSAKKTLKTSKRVSCRRVPVDTI